MQDIFRAEDLQTSSSVSSIEEAQEILDRSRTLFLALDDLATHLHTLSDLDELYLKAVVMGRSLLGIDRMGILLIDPRREWMNGTFGTDEQGNTTDERGFRVPFPERDKLLHSSLENRNFVMIRTNQTIYHMEQAVGTGWNAIYSLWDKESPLGFIACDNLLTGRPLGHFRAELFGMFASSIGSLILRKRYELGLRQRIADRSELVGRLAHEINSPLAAITSSNSTIALLAAAIARETAPFYASLSPQSRQVFDTLLSGALKRGPGPAVANKALRRELEQTLADLGMPGPQPLAEQLLLLNCPVGDQDLRTLLEVAEHRAMLDHLCRFSDLLSSSAIVEQSVEKASQFVQELIRGEAPEQKQR